MLVFFLGGLVLWAIWCVLKTSLRAMWSAGGFSLLILLILLSHGKPDRPYVQEVTFTDPVVNWANGGMPPVLGEFHVNWIALTVHSTYDHDYHPNVAVCTIQGPVYYSGRGDHGDGGGFVNRLEFEGGDGVYLGVRSLTVKLIPVGAVDFPSYRRWRMPVVPAATSTFFSPYGAPAGRSTEVLYVATTPRDRFLPDDEVTSCKLSETDISAERTIAWVGPHADVPFDMLTDTVIDDRAVQAILAAAVNVR